MEYELIIPSHMSVDAMVDQLARAVWRVLASDRQTWGLYQGYFVTVYDAIHEHLDVSLRGEQTLGAVRSLKFDAGRETASGGLENDLARAVAGRMRDLLQGSETGQLVARELPHAIHDVLEPYLWVDRAPPPPFRLAPAGAGGASHAA